MCLKSPFSVSPNLQPHFCLRVIRLYTCFLLLSPVCYKVSAHRFPNLMKPVICVSPTIHIKPVTKMRLCFGMEPNSFSSKQYLKTICSYLKWFYKDYVDP